jgi:hypothetical protein
MLFNIVLLMSGKVFKNPTDNLRRERALMLRVLAHARRPLRSLFLPSSAAAAAVDLSDPQFQLERRRQQS